MPSRPTALIDRGDVTFAPCGEGLRPSACDSVGVDPSRAQAFICVRMHTASQRMACGQRRNILDITAGNLPTRSMPPKSSRAKQWLASFRDRIAKKYPVRLHMTLILLVVTLSGMGASTLLMHLGVHRMWLRYGASVLISYLLFLAAIRIWLWYVIARNTRTAARHSSGQDSLSLDGIDGSGIVIPLDLAEGGGDSLGDLDEVVGKGGSSGGGGASASWEARTPVPIAPAGVSSSSGSSTGGSAGGSSGGSSGSSSGGSSGIGSLFDGIDGDAVIFILIAALVLALSSVWIYLIYQAPVILSEIAFHFLLASGLIRKARTATTQGWMLSTLRGTWIPLLVIIVLAVVLGFAAQVVCPDALKLRDVFGSVCESAATAT